MMASSIRQEAGFVSNGLLDDIQFQIFVIDTNDYTKTKLVMVFSKYFIVLFLPDRLGSKSCAVAKAN